MSKKSVEPELEQVVRLLVAAGMTYSEFQQKETLGLAKIVNGQLLIKDGNTWRAV